jgi:hypothetical protein
MEITNMSDAIYNSNDADLSFGDVFHAANCNLIKADVKNSSKLNWVSGQAHQGLLRDVQSISREAEQELLFVSQGLYSPMVAAMLVQSDCEQVSVQYIYAQLPEGEQGGLSKSVEHEIAQLYPHHHYCGFFTLQPSAYAQAPHCVH